MANDEKGFTGTIIWDASIPVSERAALEPVVRAGYPDTVHGLDTVRVSGARSAGGWKLTYHWD